MVQSNDGDGRGKRESNGGDRRGKRETRVLRLLEIIRTHSEAILSKGE